MDFFQVGPKCKCHKEEKTNKKKEEQCRELQAHGHGGGADGERSGDLRGGPKWVSGSHRRG